MSICRRKSFRCVEHSARNTLARPHTVAERVFSQRSRTVSGVYASASASTIRLASIRGAASCQLRAVLRRRLWGRRRQLTSLILENFVAIPASHVNHKPKAITSCICSVPGSAQSQRLCASRKTRSSPASRATLQVCPFCSAICPVANLTIGSLDGIARVGRSVVLIVETAAGVIRSAFAFREERQDCCR